MRSLLLTVHGPKQQASVSLIVPGNPDAAATEIGEGVDFDRVRDFAYQFSVEVRCPCLCAPCSQPDHRVACACSPMPLR
jgi:hypothetical protein